MFGRFRCPPVKTTHVWLRLVVRPKSSRQSATQPHATAADGQREVARLCVLGNGNDANPCSVALTSGQKTYLFNCGEGLQRLVPQYKLQVSRISHLFFTSNRWHNISGSSGFWLNQYDSGNKNFNVFGVDCHPMVKLMTHFDHKFAKNCSFNVTDYSLGGSEPFVDINVRITPVVVAADNERPAVVYVCKLLAKRGVLLLDKCFHMKIPRNLLPELMVGQSIVLTNGQTVSPSEVHTPDTCDQCFVVLECRSEAMLASLLKNEELERQLSENRSDIECVVHMTPNHVLSAGDYQQLLHRFSKRVSHLVLNEQNPSFGLHSMHRTQTQLHSLDSKVFPLINEEIVTDKTIRTFTRFDTKLVKCQTGLQYVFRPESDKGFSFDALEPFVSLKHIRDDALKEHNGNERPGLRECREQLKIDQKLLEEKTAPEAEPYPEVVFLGTCSAEPLSHRNVSSILVNISPESSIILDCGEDAFGQYYRFHGSDQLSSALNKLKAVFVTHIHTDHHIGLIRIIDRHYEYTSEPLYIFIPPIISQWLDIYSNEFEDIRHKYRVWLTTDLSIAGEEGLTSDWPKVLSKLGLKQLKAIPVNHCSDSFGVLLQTEANNRKIVFSGDAEPDSEELVTSGQGCDLLIHEATQDDDRVSLARSQCHSTVTEAIGVGQRMAAGFTILTHFSNRYGKLTLIPDQYKTDPKLGLAYDMMRVTVPELSRLPLLMPALHALYATHIVKVKDRSTSFRRRRTLEEEWVECGQSG